LAQAPLVINWMFGEISVLAPQQAKVSQHYMSIRATVEESASAQRLCQDYLPWVLPLPLSQ
ncbi:MAG: hypothetical protein PHV98_05735, partial [Candidatus Omnitrophica bacterium]|nr:hypothetical protein [Candidatus Omnitrophota bacterium]